MEKYMDSKGDVNFMMNDKFYFNNVQEFFCVCNKANSSAYLLAKVPAPWRKMDKNYANLIINN
jgi:hypothetical protein